eukprot:g3434.t1
MLLKFCLCVRLCCSTFQVGGVLKGGRFLLQRPSGAVPEWLMLESSMFLTRKAWISWVGLGSSSEATGPCWTSLDEDAVFVFPLWAIRGMPWIRGPRYLPRRLFWMQRSIALLWQCGNMPLAQ